MSRRREAPFEIPRELTIRGQRWLVAYDKDLGDGKHDARSRMELSRHGHLRAATYPKDHPHIRREIHLGSTHAGSFAGCVDFLHEAMHACRSAQDIPMRVEERLIEDVDTPLLAVLTQLEWKR